MEKKKISIREYVDRMKALRKRPAKPEFIEKFNRIMEEDELREREEAAKRDKKIARPAEAGL